jgi:UPF0716 protein FxsA
LEDLPYLGATLNDPCRYANLAAIGMTAMVKWIFIGLLAVPIAEIAVFILLVANIGLAWTLGLMLATTMAGFLVLRRAGQGRIALFRSVSDGGMRGIEAGIEANPNGFLVILGGILLVLPGFITDAIGALLLLVPIRQRCEWAFRRMAAPRGRPKDAVVDLNAGEWQELPDRELENRHGKSGGR